MTSLRLHAGLLAAVLAVGVGTAGLRTLNAAAPVSVDEAVNRFRETRPDALAPGVTSPTPSATATTAAPRGAGAGATTGPGTPGAPGAPGGPAGPGATARPGAPTTAPGQRPGPAALAPEGVYVYETVGFETGKAGPMMARHDYPAQTTMTTRRSGCGSSVRWEPVEGRWDDITDCVSGATAKVKVYDTFHEFFGVSERHTYRCSGDSWLRPPSTKAGYRWEFECVSDGAKTYTKAVVAGVERVTVGDGTVEALHVKFDTTMTGSTEGTNPSEYWIALREPHLLRKTGRVDAQVRTEFGTLDYHEEYDVRLVSRRPRT
ncbi:MAG TPA: hypothetical protein VNA20_17345 [Frankiaceae bacterium]|nr:hypothetical protein [Frankiaceae bacterium]